MMNQTRTHQGLLWSGTLLLFFFACFSMGCEQVNQRRARRLANKAVKLIKAEQYSSARSLLKEAVKLYPYDAHTRFLLARAYQGLSMTDAAITEYKRSIKLDSSKAQAYLSIGNIYFKRQKYADAVTYYQKLTKIDDDNFRGWYHLGIAHYKLGNYPEAATAFNSTIRIKKSLARAYNYLIQVFMDQAKKETEKENKPEAGAPYLQKAVDTVQRAVSAGVADERIYNLLGLVEQERKNFQNAIDAFLKAKQINNYSPHATYNVAIAYDKWLEDFIEKLQKETNAGKRAEYLKLAGEKRDKAIEYFEEFLQLKSSGGLKGNVRQKIARLKLMKKEKELLKKRPKPRPRKRRRRRR